jgi:flagellar FliL protein
MATTTVPVSIPTRRGIRPLLLVLLVLGVAAGSAGAAYYFVQGNRDKAPVIKPPVDPIFVPLDPFTVNLQPNGRNRFLHVAVTLKVSNIQAQAQLVQYLPEVRSRVLTTLSNRATESLLTTEEKSALAGEILAALNQPFAANLPSAAISSVMFTTFMLQ